MNPSSSTSYRVIYLILSIVLFITLVFSIRVGAVDLGYGQLFVFFMEILGFQTLDPTQQIDRGLFLQIRLPRVLLCCIVGAGLSVSGALMQALFRNPIVESGLIGTSAGAALGASFVFVFGKYLGLMDYLWMSGLVLPAFAFFGGFIATMMVYKISSLQKHNTTGTMILAGVAVNALASSGTGFFSYIARDPQARSITFWNLGTFSSADWFAVYINFFVALFCISIVFFYSKALNALLLGESEARYLGVDIERLKFRIIVLNTLMVGIMTAFVGVIGFVGLIVPHILRMIKTSDNHFLIVGSALLGAIMMNLADMVARSIAAPAELPIGIVTALVGAPFFLWILVSQQRKDRKGGFYA